MHIADVAEGACNTLLVADLLRYLQTPLVVLEGPIVFSYAQMHTADGVEGKGLFPAFLAFDYVQCLSADSHCVAILTLSRVDGPNPGLDLSPLSLLFGQFHCAHVGLYALLIVPNQAVDVSEVLEYSYSLLRILFQFQSFGVESYCLFIRIVLLRPLGCFDKIEKSLLPVLALMVVECQISNHLIYVILAQFLDGVRDDRVVFHPQFLWYFVVQHFLYLCVVEPVTSVVGMD